MALVLAAKTKRDGSIKSFDVVAAAEGTVQEVTTGLNEGEYKVLAGDRIVDVSTRYRQVQDIVIGDATVTVNA